MSVITELFSRIKATKAKEEASTFKVYKQMLLESEAGKEIDYDEFRIVVEKLGLSLEDTERDQRDAKRRVDAANYLEAAQAAQKQMPMVQAKLDAAVAERDRIVAEHNLTINALYEERSNLERLTGQGTPALNVLHTVLVDPEIVQAEKDVLALIKTKNNEIRKIEAVDLVEQQARIAHHARQVKKWENEIQYASSNEGHKYVAKSLQESQNHLKREQDRLKDMESKLATKRDELAKFHQQAQEIADRKLIP